MKTLNNIIAVAVAGTLAISCNTEKDEFSGYQNSPTINSLDELTISENFNWSSSIKGLVELSVNAPSYFTIEDQVIELIDESGNILDFKTVRSGAVSFYINRPQEGYKVYARYQNTGEVFEITKHHQELALNDVFAAGANSNLIKAGKKSSGSKGKTSATNLIISGDFESGTLAIDTGIYTRLRPIGNWFTRDANGTIANVNGSNVFTTINSNVNADLLQAIKVDGDEIYDFTYDYTGTSGFFVLYYDASQNFIGYTTVYTNGSQGFATFLTPHSVSYIQLYGFCKPNEILDNVNMVEAFEPDDDGDGVSNRQDDYPNDPTRAYAKFFPTIGRQTLAFEDLWPAKGDFDFNDMVLSNEVEFRKDNNNNLVDAIVSVKVKGMGASLPSGIGLHLLDANLQPLSTDIIASISGSNGIQDPDVTNGFILLDNVKKALSPMYNNNGKGPDGTPQEFTFTITFKAGTGNIDIIPDFYIFRTNTRGRETHQGGYPATAAADASLNNTKSDYNGTYKTATGIPWVIEVVHPNVSFFHHPLEKVDITDAYPKFRDWAESDGKRYVGWMLLGDKTKLYIL